MTVVISPAAHGRDTGSVKAARSRVLTAYIAAGLVFMLVPGTFLGVWNLLQVSSRGDIGLVSPPWLQAHGHAQVFGWIGTFILGIGFYSVPRLRPGSTPVIGAAWTCWVLWLGGVTLRWSASLDAAPWRVLMPLSAALELAAFLMFFAMVSRHRPTQTNAARIPSPTSGSSWLAPWVRVVGTASLGFALTLVGNLAICIYLAGRNESPVAPHALNQRFLVLATWGWLAPFVWGFSLNWLPVFLGLPVARPQLVLAAAGLNAIGVLLALAGRGAAATPIFVVASLLVVAGLRLFEPAVRAPKTRGVHSSFPLFVRLAYVWLLIAAMLGVVASRWDVSGGIWGASRHAFTVGFISAMVFSIGQRVLPEFAAARPLWSPRLMFVSLALLSIGCAARVFSEILAYQHYARWAWSVLPASAVIEMAAVSCFALNLGITLLMEPSRPTAPHESRETAFPIPSPHRP
jgi:uncharacterized protein involved in response to NO